MSPQVLEPNTTQPESTHGRASGYSHWGCRCERCAEWMRALHRGQRERYLTASHEGKTAPRVGSDGRWIN